MNSHRKGASGEREPKYICFDTRILALVQRLPESERLLFYDGLYAAYMDKHNGTSDYIPPDSITGDLIMQADETMRDGYDTYMKKVNANPSGKKSSTDPVSTHREASDLQSNKDQSKKDQNNTDQSIQIRKHLIDEGYSDSEISSAIVKCDFQAVRNPAAYVRQTIENQRRQQGTSRKPSADNFAQRDYSGVPEEVMRSLATEMEEFKRENPDLFDEEGHVIG